jgi:antitoxin MazE7
MTLTTIKVDSAVRDRLARVARARGTTMGALLDAVAQRLETDQRWQEIGESIDRLQRDDPAGWQEYLAELAAWDATGTDVGIAAQEWPEFTT